MTVWTTFLLAFAAFTLAAASMDRHSEHLGIQSLKTWTIPLCRTSGFVLLGASLLRCLQHWDTSVAIASWLGLLTLSAMSLALVFTYAPQKAKLLAGGAVVLGALLWIAAFS